MTCKEFLYYFDGLDINEPIEDPIMKEHINTCNSCSKDINKISFALKLYAKEKPEYSQKLENKIMAIIAELPKPLTSHNYKWIIAVLAILASIIIAPIAEASGILNSFSGSNYKLWLNIILGTALTTLSAFYIASHIKQVESFLSRFGFKHK